MIDSPNAREGVLPNHQLEEAVRQGAIGTSSGGVPKENIQPASLDLRLGRWAYQMQCSFLPAGQTVEERFKDLVIDRISLRNKGGAVLAPGRPYLIPLKEELDLPATIRAKANPKSSTGRADVFTRVITDRGYRFDEIEPGYRGGLYLEVVPLSFPVRVAENLTLNQLRLSRGQAQIQLTDREIAEYHQHTAPLLFAEGRTVENLQLGNGLFLGLDLSGDNGRYVGYRAKGSPPLLDLRRSRQADTDRYWDRVRSEPGNRIVLQPRAFYLLMSYEAVTIPPDLAAEMTAYDPTSGELRTHYAGFFDPGFGYDRDGAFRGSTAALEVRAHDVPFMIEDRQPVCKLTFERMAEEPSQLYGDAIGSNYQRQTETLGKHFVPPGNYPKQRAPGKTQPGDEEDLLDLLGVSDGSRLTVETGDDE
ncbi:MAG TPA: 2'-deoxycytidine 5'-triphosphate deaminase [Nakamurella sp.]